jgi:glycerol kinase
MVQKFNEEGLGLTISLETYIKWERGTGQPNAENLPIIEKILNEK